MTCCNLASFQRVLLSLVAIASFSLIGCDSTAPYVVAELEGVPLNTKSITLFLSVGWLQAEQDIDGKPDSISFWLPTDSVGLDGEKRQFLGAEIRVIVEAFDDVQVIAFGSARKIINQDLRQEMKIEMLGIPALAHPIGARGESAEQFRDLHSSLQR